MREFVTAFIALMKQARSWLSLVTMSLAHASRATMQGLSVPRVDESGLRGEMFWPCAVILMMCAAPLGYGFAPLIWGAM